MNLVVNGEARELPDGATVALLLVELGADAARVAVMVNKEIVASSGRAAKTLCEGDKVEVLAFAGGG